jgi:hypothetical protein
MTFHVRAQVLRTTDAPRAIDIPYQAKSAADHADTQNRAPSGLIRVPHVSASAWSHAAFSSAGTCTGTCEVALPAAAAAARHRCTTRSCPPSADSGTDLRVRDKAKIWSPSNPEEFADWFCTIANKRFVFQERMVKSTIAMDEARMTGWTQIGPLPGTTALMIRVRLPTISPVYRSRPPPHWLIAARVILCFLSARAEVSKQWTWPIYAPHS